jgi:hypothetical protein
MKYLRIFNRASAALFLLTALLVPVGYHFGIPAMSAQNAPSSFVVTYLQGSASAGAAALGNGVPAIMYGYNTIACQVISASFSGTITFEETIDGTDWVSAAGYPSGGTTSAGSATYVTTVTGAGIWTFPIPATAMFWARISTYNSGAVTVVALVASSAK